MILLWATSISYLDCCRSFLTGLPVSTLGCVYLCSVTQSCLTLCNPVGCSPPGSSVHGISQGRILEWVAISSSRRSSQPRDWTQVFLHCGRVFYYLSHQGSPLPLVTYSLTEQIHVGIAPGTSNSAGKNPALLVLSFCSQNSIQRDLFQR